MRHNSVLLWLSLLLTACSFQQPLQEFDIEDDLPTEEEKPVHEVLTVSESALEALGGTTLTGASIIQMKSTGVIEIGVEDAPLTLTVFLDPHCEYCRQFMQEHFLYLRNDFVVPGQLRIRLVPLHIKKYITSMGTIQALVCAGQFNRGMGMHQRLYERPSTQREALVSYALEMGIAETEFSSCIDREETAAVIADLKRITESLDVSLAPTFILENEKRIGLPFYPDLRGWVRSQL